MHQSGNDEIAVQEVMHLQQCLAFQIFVRHLQVHLVGFLLGAGSLACRQFLFLFFQLDLADDADKNDGTDDTQHA